MDRHFKFAKILGLLLIFCMLVLTIPAIAQDVVQVRVTTWLNLRQGPGTQYPVISRLTNGTRWYTYGSSNNWLNLNIGWIYGGYTVPSYPIKIVVTTASDGLNARLGPSTKYAIKNVLPINTIAEVLETKNGWFRINNEHWISGYYTKALDNKTYGWYYIANNEHKVPQVSTKINISKYDGYYVGDTSSKKIYLTFDLGYEAGYTPAILDTLKENNVKAAFFVAKSYIDQYPDLIQRMVNEGHIVGNHTNTHPSLPSIATNIAAFNKELTSTEAAYKKVTGKDMLKVMRPPMGEYSELSLYLTKRLGYKSFFWSFAYYDYDQENQPSEADAFKKITGGTHNGAILLLHGVSKTNTKILDSVIDDIKNQGYEFCTIDTL